MNYFVKVDDTLIGKSVYPDWVFHRGSSLAAELSAEEVARFFEHVGAEFHKHMGENSSLVAEGMKFEVLPATDAVKVALRLTEK